jgi:chromosome segregation ATPase
MGALNFASGSDVERLEKRLRSLSGRLEEIEDRLDDLADDLTDVSRRLDSGEGSGTGSS